MAAAESEAALIVRARRGDGDAYATLVRSHEHAARRAALAIVRSPSDAEEATQEAFLKAYRALPRFRAGMPFRPWLLAIVSNEARNVRRRSARHLRLAAAASADAPQTDEPADAAALERLDHRAVVTALGRLPEPDRRALVARYVAGLDSSEVGAVLGVSPVAARVRIWRALERLRAELAAVGVLALAVAVLLAVSPTARAAARALVDLIPGVTITQVGDLHEPGPDVAPGYLGEQTSLDLAVIGAPFRLRRLPGEPTLVYARNDVRGGMVTLVHGDVSLTQWAAQGSEAAFEVRGARVEHVDVRRADGLWVDGPARAVYTFVGADGLRHHEAFDTGGTLLLWQEGGVAFRLEGASTREQALELVAVLRR